MNLIEKLNFLMKKRNIKNVAILAKETDIPYTTLRSIFGGDVNDVRLSTSRKLCDYFNITLDELLDDSIELKISQINISIIDEIKKVYGNDSIRLLEKYNLLNETGKEKLLETAIIFTKVDDYTCKDTETKDA